MVKTFLHGMSPTAHWDGWDSIFYIFLNMKATISNYYNKNKISS